MAVFGAECPPICENQLQERAMFPSLVAEILIERMGNMNLLRKLRQVNRQWNLYTSRVLRKRTQVELHEFDKERCQQFLQVLRLSHPQCSIISAFKFLAVTFSSCTYAPLVHLLLVPTLFVRRLVIIITQPLSCVPLANVQLVLRANSCVMRELVLVGSEIGGVHPTPDLGLTGGPPVVLKLLTFKVVDTCENCSHKSMFQSLIAISRSEDVGINVVDNTLLDKLLSSLNTQRLHSLQLTATNFSNQNWTALLCTGFSELRNLRLVTQRQASLPNKRRMEALVRSVKSNLRTLSSNVVRIPTLPPCPQLQEVCLMHNYNLVGLTDKNFPHLKSVNLEAITSNWKCLNHNCIPHKGVTHLSFTCSPLATGCATSIWNLLFTLTSLKHHFPNVTLLQFGSMYFGAFALSAVFHTYPHILELWIDSPGDLSSVMGITSDCLAEYIDAGWHLEDIPRATALKNFEELRIIVFGPSFMVTPEMVQHCFPELPALEQLAFYWNKRLDAGYVGNQLSNVFSVFVLGLIQDTPASATLECFGNFNCFYRT